MADAAAGPIGETPSPVSGPAAGVLVVGYGSPLRSDDGVGPAVAERLATDPRLAGADVRAAHQLTPELAPDIAGARLLVLVDADDAAPAGEVVVRHLVLGDRAGGDGPAGRADEGGPPLTHHVDPASLLAFARELWGSAPPAVIVGIGPASLDLGDTLTAVVDAAVPRAVEAVAAAVEAHLAGDVRAQEG